MKAVVPAAGEGTRLRPFTEDTPKGLVEVASKPILTHCFERLVEFDADELVVVVGYRKEQIVERYGDAFEGIPITYVHQRERRGLAHALVQAEAHVDDDFLLLNGDNVLLADLGRPIARKREEGVDAVVLVEDASWAEARTTGVVVTDGVRVTGMVEKPADPPSTLVSAGCYVFSPDVFDACRQVEPGAGGEYQLSDAVNRLCRAGKRVVAVRLDGWRTNVNTPEDVARAEHHLRDVR